MASQIRRRASVSMPWMHFGVDEQQDGPVGVTGWAAYGDQLVDTAAWLSRVGPETLERRRQRVRQRHATGGALFRHELDLEPARRPQAGRTIDLCRQRRHARHSPT